MLFGSSSLNRLSGRVVDCCFQVYSQLGPGLLEKVYGDCLSREFSLSGIACLREYPVSVNYKGVMVSEACRIDFLVEDLLVVELKAVEQLLPVHTAQVMTYLKLLKRDTGLLINFNSACFSEGIRRIRM